MLKNILISQIVPSKTNPRGDFKVKEFDELVSSIQAKGILMPILVRPIKGKADSFEVVAGHRRLAAAKVAGLDKVPAQVTEMTDVEAREAQIVENLQRQDVHPLDEGEAYRALIEKSKPRYTTADVALKVGKSDGYVRSRLALTNLIDKAGKAFRNGDITIGHAVLIARIEDDKMQAEALKRATEYHEDVGDLRDWIQDTIYLNLSNKPWAKDAKLAEMVGDNSKKGPSLFDDPSAGVDPVAYAQQMAAFIEIKVREYKEKGEELVKIATCYGTPDTKGAIGRNEYRIVEKGDKPKTVKKGIIVEGDGVGKIVVITTDKEITKESTVYKQTPAEKEARKKQIEKERIEKEERNQKIIDGTQKVKMPLSEKHLDVLFDIAFRRFGFSYIQPVAARHGIKAVKVKRGGYDHRDLEGPTRKHFENLGVDGKLQFIFEVGLEATGGSNDGIDAFLKKL